MLRNHIVIMKANDGGTLQCSWLSKIADALAYLPVHLPHWLRVESFALGPFPWTIFNTSSFERACMHVQPDYLTDLPNSLDRSNCFSYTRMESKKTKRKTEGDRTTLLDKRQISSDFWGIDLKGQSLVGQFFVLKFSEAKKLNNQLLLCVSIPYFHGASRSVYLSNKSNVSHILLCLKLSYCTMYF